MKHPKKCPKCGQWKEENEDNFHRDKTKATGFVRYCKHCALLMQKESRAKGFHMERENLVDDPTFDDFDRYAIIQRRQRATGLKLSIHKPI